MFDPRLRHVFFMPVESESFFLAFPRRACGLVVMIVACQVMDPGSIPGERRFLFLPFGFEARRSEKLLCHAVLAQFGRAFDF